MKTYCVIGSLFIVPQKKHGYLKHGNVFALLSFINVIIIHFQRIFDAACFLFGFFCFFFVNVTFGL